MRGHGQKLTYRQEQAIAGLLTASTLTEAAKHAGISEATLWRWLKREEFQVAYRAARREAVAQAVAQLQQTSGEAVQALRSIMANPAARDGARVTAARAILELALKAVELEDLESRLAALESHLATPTAGGSRHGA
jgi:phage terminase small subunit